MLSCETRAYEEGRYRLDTQIWLSALLATLFAAISAGGAWTRGWLNRDGALAAFLLGWLVYFTGEWGASFTLLFFFVTSSAWSVLPERPKSSTSPLKEKERGSRFRSSPGRGVSPRRNARQVLANGLVAVLACLYGRTVNALSPALPESMVIPAWIAFTAALAEATGDTWASELGRRFGGPPHRLWDFRPVPPGTSGAVSLIGILAALAGAGLIALVSAELALTGLFPFLPVTVFAGVAYKAAATAALAGFLGSLADSWLGSRWQARYRCDHCGVEIEEAVHWCGRPAHLCRGLRWLDNDMVNLFSTVVAAALGLASIFLIACYRP